MWDIFSFSFWADFWQTHGLWLMFFSAFLSATILPGNSEIVFVSLAAPKVLVGSLLSADIFWLVFMATAGNTLGSLTTYWIGRWFPKNWQQKWPHFMGDKQNTTLWRHLFIIELVAYCRGCVLCSSRLASIELAKLFDFYDDWKRTALYSLALFQFTFRVIVMNSLCA